MKRIILVCSLLLASVPAFAQGFVQVTASSCIFGADAQAMVSGTFSIVGTDGSNHPIPFRIGNGGVGSGSGQVITAPVTRQIINGSLQGTLYIANPAISSPQNIKYQIVIQDNTTKRITTYSGVNIVPNDVTVAGHFTVFNFCYFDTGLVDPTIPITLVQGPPGPGLSPKGAWVNSTTYSIGDMVVSGSNVYASITNNNLNHAVTDTTNWMQLPFVSINYSSATVINALSNNLGTVMVPDGTTDNCSLFNTLQAAVPSGGGLLIPTGPHKYHVNPATCPTGLLVTRDDIKVYGDSIANWNGTSFDEGSGTIIDAPVYTQSHLNVTVAHMTSDLGGPMSSSPFDTCFAQGGASSGTSTNTTFYDLSCQGSAILGHGVLVQSGDHNSISYIHSYNVFDCAASRSSNTIMDHIWGWNCQNITVKSDPASGSVINDQVTNIDCDGPSSSTGCGVFITSDDSTVETHATVVDNVNCHNSAFCIVVEVTATGGNAGKVDGLEITNVNGRNIGTGAGYFLFDVPGTGNIQRVHGNNLQFTNVSGVGFQNSSGCTTCTLGDHNATGLSGSPGVEQVGNFYQIRTSGEIFGTGNPGDPMMFTSSAVPSSSTFSLSEYYPASGINGYFSGNSWGATICKGHPGNAFYGSNSILPYFDQPTEVDSFIACLANNGTLYVGGLDDGTHTQIPGQLDLTYSSTGQGIQASPSDDSHPGNFFLNLQNTGRTANIFSINNNGNIGTLGRITDVNPNHASSGFINMIKSDCLAWENNGGTGENTLCIVADALQFNGAAIGGGGGGASSFTTLSGGSNNNGNFICTTGCSFTYANSGIVNANQVSGAVPPAGATFVGTDSSRKLVTVIGLLDSGANGVVTRTSAGVTTNAGPSDIAATLGYVPMQLNGHFDGAILVSGPGDGNASVANQQTSVDPSGNGNFAGTVTALGDGIHDVYDFLGFGTDQGCSAGQAWIGAVSGTPNTLKGCSDGTEFTVGANGGGGYSWTQVTHNSAYSLATGDFSVPNTSVGNELNDSSSSPVLYTLLATAPTSGAATRVFNSGSSTLSVSPNGINLNGATTTIMFGTNQGAEIWSNGTVYFYYRFSGKIPISSATLVGRDSSGNEIVTPLTSTDIFVGNGSNLPVGVALNGDCTLSNTGTIVCTKTNGNGFAPVSTSGSATDLGTGTLPDARLNNVATAGSCTNCNATFDAHGRVTTYANGTGGGSSGTTVIYTANHTVGATDAGTVVMNCTSACAVTLPASGLSSSFKIDVISIGSTTATVSLSSLNFNGGATAPVLRRYISQSFSSDGSNYFGKVPYVAGTHITLTPTANADTIASAQIKTCEIDMNGTGTGGLLQSTDAYPAGCMNGLGSTLTITSFRCRADQSGSSTVQITVDGGSAILTGAVTLTGTSWVTGTLSGTPTMSDGTSASTTLVPDGVQKYAHCVMAGTF